MSFENIHDFWFGEDMNPYSEEYKFQRKLWFHCTEKCDTNIKNTYEGLLNFEANNFDLDKIDTPKKAVDYIILFDQFPRHIYRATSQAFAYDKIAIQVARKVIENNWCEEISIPEAIFIYMCFLHQEDEDMVKIAVEGFDRLSVFAQTKHTKIIKNFKTSAVDHLETIEKFGRYPHRNAAIGRDNTEDETIFLETHTESLYMKSQKPNNKKKHERKRNMKIINEVKRTDKPLKILCLHGWRQNGKVFKNRVKKLNNFLFPIADLHFVTAPHTYSPQEEIKEAFLQKDENIPEFKMQRCWWNSIENNKIYMYINETIEFMKEVWKSEGPFDGIIGFAQGGTLAAILASEEFQTKFIIPISAYTPRADQFKNFKPIKIPSLHIFGEKDILVTPDRSLDLYNVSNTEGKSKYIQHEGAHFTPNLWPYQEIKDFISQFTPYEREAKKIFNDWKIIIASVNEDNVYMIAKMFAEQLLKEFSVGYKMQNKDNLGGKYNKYVFSKPEDKYVIDMCNPSDFVDFIPRSDNFVEKKYKLVTKICNIVFPNLIDKNFYVAYSRSTSTLRALRKLRAPEYEEYRYVKNNESRISIKAFKTISDLPLSKAVVEPKPEDVRICKLEDLFPLFEHLNNDKSVDDQIIFKRGAITVDGRLDLCKQVVGPKGIKPLLEAMSKCSKVKKLLLGNNIVSDTGAQDIADAIPSSTLECWYIAGNNITEIGIEPIVNSLKNNQYCTSLWLKRNPLGAAGMVHIANLFKVNTFIKVLDLVNCGLLDEGVNNLLEGFMDKNGNCEGKNKTLKVIFLDTNGITQKSAPIISKFIENCSLEDISLSCNRFSDNGAKIISQGLNVNRTIKRFGFASNRITHEGAKYFAEALSDHPVLEHFDLGHTRATGNVEEVGNFIGDVGASYIAEMLKTNKMLKSLSLLHNAISQIGINTLIKGLEFNTTLVYFQFTQFGKVTNEPGKEAIKKILNHNYEILSQEDKIRCDKIDTPDYISEIRSVYRNK